MNIEEAAEKIAWDFCKHKAGYNHYDVAKLIKSDAAKQYWFEQFKAEQKQTIVTELPEPYWDDSVTHNLELVSVEDKLWEEISAHAYKMLDSPSFDYGTPYWAIADFLDNIRKEYSITKK